MSSGFVLAATGCEIYHRMTLTLIEDIRKLMPDVGVAVFTDKPSWFSGLEAKQVRHTPERPFASKIEACIRSPFRKSVYLDADTRILRPVYELFDLLDFCDIAMGFSEGREAMASETWHPRDSGLPLSSSTIAFRTEKTRILMNQWFEEYQEGTRFPNRGDQMYLARLATIDPKVKLLVLPSEFRLNSGLPQFIGANVKILTGPTIRGQEKMGARELDSVLNNSARRRMVWFINTKRIWEGVWGYSISLKNLRGGVWVAQLIRTGTKKGFFLKKQIRRTNRIISRKSTKAV